MMHAILILIFLFLMILFNLRNSFKSNINKKFFRGKNFVTFNKNNLNKWMKLTKRERYDLSKQESINYMNKRKNLLAAIRKEYKKISKENSQ